MPEDMQTVGPSDGSGNESAGSNDEHDGSTSAGDEPDGGGTEPNGGGAGPDGGSDEPHYETDEPRYGSDAGDDRFGRLEDVDYDRVNDFLKQRVAFTAREWALARLCADFRTKTGVEMTKVGERLPQLVPFMDDEYTRQGVYQARRSFEEKVREAGATFLYGAYSGFLTAEEVDDVMYEATEVARFLLEVEGADVSYEDEIEAEERLKRAMRAVHEASVDLRYDRCPHCGEELSGEEAV